MRRLAVRGCLAALALWCGVAVSSCTSVRNTLGTHVSACFRVLPEADQAVDQQGQYKGVHFEPVRSLLLDIHKQHLGSAADNPPAAIKQAEHFPVCLVEYNGNYQLAGLEDGWSPSGAPTGSYAIVVVRQSDSRVVATVLLQHEPERFSRTYPT
jgi:hypothetical protein